MLKKHFYTISYIGWMVFVTFSSLYSFKGMKPRAPLVPHADKLVHFTFYFLAVILGVLFLREITNGRLKFKKAISIMVFSMIFLGGIIEYLQEVYTLNRTGDIFDFLANTLGALMGLLVIKYVFSNRQTLKWRI